MTLSLPRLSLLLILAALELACRDAPQSSRQIEAGRYGADSIIIVDGDTTYIVDSDDWELLSAAKDARQTLAEFIRRLREPPETQTELALKVRFAELSGGVADSVVEHLWLDVFDFDGSRFRGFLETPPNDLRRVRMGDTIVVDSAQVSDWYAVDRDTLVGGFSIRVFRDRLNAKQRADEDRNRPYVVNGRALDEYRRIRALRP